MTWLTPLAGAILAAVVIPPLILLYFLKLRRRTQKIASTLLWMRAVEDLRANAPFQRLRRSLLLLLQLIVLTLLAVSIMQPQIQLGRRDGGKTVILIDNSASMAAIDGPEGRSRLDEAKRLARERVEAMYGGGLFTGDVGETMVIAFADRALVTSSFSTSKLQLLAAIDRIQPTHSETLIGEALKLARAYTTNVDPEQQGRLIAEPAALEIFSDGRIADQSEQVLRGERAFYHPVGKPEAENIAITSIAVERPFDRPTHVEVFAAVRNYIDRDVACDIQLSVDGTVRAIEEVTVPAASRDPATQELVPGQNNVVYRPFEQPRGAVIEVANLRPDDLTADNVAQLVVAPPQRLNVALVAPQSRLVRSVIEGLGFVEQVEILSADQFERQAQAGTTDRYDVIVFDNYAPSAPELMPPGRYLTFGPTPPVEGLNEYGRGEQQVILGQKDAHPSLRFVNLENLYIAKFYSLQPADDVEVIAEGSSGPAIVAVSRGPMQVIHTTFDPLDSNWPLLRSFVTYIFNCVDYLGHVGTAVTTQSFKPGEAIVTRLPASASDIQIRTPEETDRIATGDPTSISWGPVRLTGLHEITWAQPDTAERQSQTFAVNLLSATEGRIGTLPTITFSQDPIAGEVGASTSYTPLWPWALGACLGMLMIEWWIYHRKTYV